MSFVRKTIKQGAIGVGVADEPSGLNAFLRPGCAAAIWRRQVPSDVQSWLDDLHPAVLPRGRFNVSLDTVSDTLDRLFDDTGLPNGSERHWLHQDILFLSYTFSDLMRSRHLRIRLEAVQTNACRKFHIDAIMARLICTYRGTGTQYGISTDGEIPKRVFTAPTGSPMALRGTLWPEQPSCGLLHRSPPIEGTGETRLVLVLDPILDPGDDA